MLSTYVDTLAQSHDFVLAELKRMDEQNHQICCTVKPQRITEAASRRLSQRLVCEEENLRFSTFVSSFPYSQLEHLTTHSKKRQEILTYQNTDSARGFQGVISVV
jgi:pyruvate-formate lyase-activating enzyme